ncbi:hypothetical protein MGU_09900 [Metarhizium guizhouense ARSEF 977]|uniref:Uncharacterized protein n=1 Tax=Metarhizium guizhouense (strain ARSEF 977) TaxID=1276136 RepID=A0A0B4GJT8_METGA|nr:hypothetical protein MGU_09900 [Metarhizium guizhouense ARSEF 977]
MPHERVGHAASSSAPMPLGFSGAASSAEPAVSTFPRASLDLPSVLSPPSSDEWAGMGRLAVETHHQNGAQGRMRHDYHDPSFAAHGMAHTASSFALEELTLPRTNMDLEHCEGHALGSVVQPDRCGSSDVLLSPTSLTDSNTIPNMEGPEPAPFEALAWPDSGIPLSKADQMISNVENLHDFGVWLALFPEDPSLRKWLARIKERFRRLTRAAETNVDHHQRDFACGLDGNLAQENGR